MKSKLPKDFVKEGLKLAENGMLFGIPLKELSRDELLAAVAQGWNREKKEREERIRQLKILRKS